MFLRNEPNILFVHTKEDMFSIFNRLKKEELKGYTHPFYQGTIEGKRIEDNDSSLHSYFNNNLYDKNLDNIIFSFLHERSKIDKKEKFDNEQMLISDFVWKKVQSDPDYIKKACEEIEEDYKDFFPIKCILDVRDLIKSGYDFDPNDMVSIKYCYLYYQLRRKFLEDPDYIYGNFFLWIKNFPEHVGIYETTREDFLGIICKKENLAESISELQKLIRGDEISISTVRRQHAIFLSLDVYP